MNENAELTLGALLVIHYSEVEFRWQSYMYIVQCMRKDFLLYEERFPLTVYEECGMFSSLKEVLPSKTPDPFEFPFFNSDFCQRS